MEMSPIRPKTHGALFILSLLFLFSALQLQAWSFHTHRKIVSDALSQMPLSFQKRFGECKEMILEGSTFPDTDLKDFQNHVYHVHGGNMHESATHMRELFESIVGKIRRKDPDKDTARWFGLYAHYIADLNQPLHTDGESMDPNEDSYHMKFEKEIEGQLSRIPLGTITFEPVQKPVERMLTMVEAANKRYLEVGRAYRGGNRIFDLMPMVTEQYQAAVKNVMDYWLGIMKEAGEPCEMLPPPMPLMLSEQPTASDASFQRMPTSSVPSSMMVDLNTASLEQLMSLPGVGEKKARTIMDARPFKSIYDLSKLKGFGIKFIERISDRITVGQ